MTEVRQGEGCSGAGQLVVASNRLPIALTREAGGRWRRERGSGGLVTALEPVLRERGGVWIGWPGVVEGQVPDLDRVLAEEGGEAPYRVEPVALTRDERRDFYRGFSNEILWPLCHGLLGRCTYEPRYWRAYRQVNRRFAEAVARVARPADTVWVHDYHLMAVADELRRKEEALRLAFFLHIPFPPLDIFEQLPWAREVLDSLLAYGTLGFQTRRDLQNFTHCVDEMAGADALVDEPVVRLQAEGRETRAGSFGISIDFEAFDRGSRTPRVEEEARRLREDINAELVLLGVDRLDYTKGIPQKLLGLERALEAHPDLRGRVTLFQLVVPSRNQIPEYGLMKDEIEGLVGRINGRFTRRGWAPILYRFGSWTQEELLAYYRLADVAVVTPLRDGMNLVSKEYVTCSVDGRGVLVLSAFAGSADELGDGALVVNPNDVDAVAEAIHTACTMAPREKARRLELLRERVRRQDVHHWVSSFLGAHEGAAAQPPSTPMVLSVVSSRRSPGGLRPPTTRESR